MSKKTLVHTDPLDRLAAMRETLAKHHQLKPLDPAYPAWLRPSLKPWPKRRLPELAHREAAHLVSPANRGLSSAYLEARAKYQDHCEKQRQQHELKKQAG